MSFKRIVFWFGVIATSAFWAKRLGLLRTRVINKLYRQLKRKAERLSKRALTKHTKSFKAHSLSRARNGHLVKVH